MSNTEQNKAGRWQDRLDALDAMPSQEPLDKAAAWEKLQSRFEPRRRPSRRAWFYAAAAAAVLLVVLLLNLQKDGSKEELPLAKKPAPAVQSNQPIEQALVEKLTIPGEETRSNSSVRAIKKYLPTKKETAANQDRSQQIPVQPSPEIAATPIPVPTVEPLATTPTVAVTPPPAAKKMRVVHINEIEKAAADERTARERYSRPPWKAEPAGTPAQPAAAWGRLSIRINPSN